MKKFLLSALVIIVFVVYAIHTNLENESAPIVIKPNIVIPVPTFSPIPTQSFTRTLVSSTPVLTGTPQGQYKDGTFTGSVADAFYGNVQVQVTISGGNITDVQFLQYPNDRSTSQMINSQAMPLLIQEVIQAQSAQVDGVSGATQTSGAFIQSLQSALSQAS